MSAPDQVLMSGVLASGAPVSIHYRGGMPRDGEGLLWEINGTDGDVRVTGPTGHAQMVPLLLTAARDDEKTFQAVEIPASFRSGFPEDVAPGKVARIYAKMAQDLGAVTRTAPSFDDAVAIHRIVAAIEKSAGDGQRTDVMPR
jgi:predicted dehydrogenase